MISFEDWVNKNHPEYIEEGWAKNLALGGALMGAGMGIGGMMKGGGNTEKNIPSQSVTSPDAASYLGNSQSVTSPDAASYFGNSQSSRDSSWNSELGNYTATKQNDGSYIYHTKNGNYKRVPSKFLRNQFVKIN